jgi:hypothetical protein
MGLIITLRKLNPPLPSETPLNLAIDILPNPQPPSSPEWRNILKQKNFVSFEGKVWDEASEQLNKQIWLSEPQAVETFLQKHSDKLKLIKAAFASSQCIPVDTEYTSGEFKWQYLALIRGVKALALESVLQTQTDHPDQAATTLLLILERLLFYDQSCQLNLIGAMIVVASSRLAQQAMTYVLRHPKLAPNMATKLLANMAAWERRPCSLAQAIRIEGQWRKQVIFDIDSVADAAKHHSNNLKRMTFWPFYVPKHTLQMNNQIVRCHLRLTQTPLTPKNWDLCPIEIYLARLRNTNPIFNIFRYNAVGKILMGLGMPSFRRYVAMWYRERCMTSARRALLLQQLPHIQALSIKASHPQPVDLLTEKSITADHLKDQKQLCVGPEFLKGQYFDSNQQPLAPLPPWPPSTPAKSQPQTTP